MSNNSQAPARRGPGKPFTRTNAGESDEKIEARIKELEAREGG